MLGDCHHQIKRADYKWDLMRDKTFSNSAVFKWNGAGYRQACSSSLHISPQTFLNQPNKCLTSGLQLTAGRLWERNSLSKSKSWAAFNQQLVLISHPECRSWCFISGVKHLQLTKVDESHIMEWKICFWIFFFLEKALILRINSKTTVRNL